MKIIVNTVPLKKEKLKSFIPIFSKLKFNDIELHFDHFFSNDYNIDDVLTLFKTNNINVLSMAGGWCDFFYDGNVKEKTFLSVAKQVGIMKKFDCTKLRLFFGRIPKDKYNSDVQKILINNLRELSDKYPDITFIFETHDNISVDYKILKPLLKQIKRKNIKINFDPANIEKEGYDSYQFLTEIREWIDHLHVKGLKSLKGKEIKDFFCSYGEGILSYDKIFKFLKATNYTGYLSIEFEGYGYPILELYNSKIKLEEDLR